MNEKRISTFTYVKPTGNGVLIWVRFIVISYARQMNVVGTDWADLEQVALVCL